MSREIVSERNARRQGVWNDPSAPDGYVALLVISSSGRRLIRIEIAQDCYSHAWVSWLEKWLRRWDVGVLRIIR